MIKRMRICGLCQHYSWMTEMISISRSGETVSELRRFLMARIVVTACICSRWLPRALSEGAERMDGDGSLDQAVAK